MQKLALSCDDLLSSAHWEAGTSQSETGNESTSSHLDSQPEPSATESTSAVGVTEETQQDEEKDEQKNERKKKRRCKNLYLKILIIYIKSCMSVIHFCV